jgi:hypothetical protein
VRLFRRRSTSEPLPSKELDTAPVEVGGDRMVFWKAKSEEVEGEIYGPVWIADANDPNVTLEEHDEWLTWEQAEEFARTRRLPIEDV